MDRENSVAHRHGERSPLAARLARRPPLPDAMPGRRRPTPRLLPREGAALVVVVVAALVTALATSGSGWGSPLRAAAPDPATEVVSRDGEDGAAGAEQPTATIEPAPTSTPEPTATATDLPTETPSAPPTEVPTERSAEEAARPGEPSATPEEVPSPTGEPISTATPAPTDPPAAPETLAPDQIASPATPPAPAASPVLPTEESTESLSQDPGIPPTEAPAGIASPPAEPVATAEPADSGESSGTPAAIPEPAASPVSPVMPAEQEAGESSEAVALALSANPPATADPGAAVEFAHTLSIAAPTPEETRLALRLTTRLGWPVSIAIAGQPMPLLDGDGDGVFELSVAPGQTEVPLLVRTETPPDALADERETIELAAWGAEDSPEMAVAADDEIVVNRVLIVRVAPDTTHFGQVTPNGTLDPSVPGITSVVDREGAWYVKERAVVVSVTTNEPLVLTCASEPSEPAVAERLAWRLTGSTTWTTFGAFDGPDAVCLPPLEPGVHLFVFDVRLRVNWVDPPGAIDADVSLNPLPSPRPDGPESAQSSAPTSPAQ